MPLPDENLVNSQEEELEMEAARTLRPKKITKSFEP